MENKIDFQFGPVFANQTCPNYSVALEASKMKQKSSVTNGLYTPEWFNCEKCEKIS